VPQLAQNFAPGAPSTPHAEQNRPFGGARLAPHSAQNFPAGTLALQLGQLVVPPAPPGAC
jgi:hypothetical protein